MTENPYQSPQSAPDGPAPLDPQWRALASRPRRQVVVVDRPTVVTVIAVLQLVFYFQRSREQKYLAATGIAVAAVIVEAAEIGVLLLTRTKL